MTDNEIIKALESYKNDIGCMHCGVKDNYLLTTIKNALDLINRQQKDIDDLCKVLGRAYQENCFLEASRKSVRTEAVKEFAERLKKPNRWREEDIYYIDTLVEEMVGEE